ncbi:terpenoid synthase [Suillus bovinus]|uniref:terpenoid synthase n=1 Tax=Suillus bovinus TaxID=48563 RepID=UPI001B878523|nr:terpenoid synthase [Suillus bovinus]KAG2136963.1 terpenoid synthase [Suillus bovinus]
MDANHSSFSMATFILNTVPAWVAHLVSGLGAQLVMDKRNMAAFDRPIAGGLLSINASNGCDKPQKKIFIPDILARWPFPRHLNQYYFQVRAESSAWFASFEAFSPKAQQAFDRSNFSLLTCLSNLNACEEHVRIACDFMNLAFAIDEYTDGLKEDEVRQQKDVIMDAMRHPHKPRPKGEWVGGEVARQFWEHTICYASGQTQKHLIAALDECLEGIMQQAIDRNKHHIRDIQSHIDVRCRSVGAQPMFALLELGLDIPDEVISHPTIKDIVVASTEMIALANDITSYNVEQARGDDGHNIVTIVMHDLDTDVNGAMLWVMDRHIKLEKKYFEAAAAIPKWGEPIDSQVREYCDGLGNWVRANYEWSFESERYFGTNGLEIRRKRWILLMQKDN